MAGLDMFSTSYRYLHAVHYPGLTVPSFGQLHNLEVDNQLVRTDFRGGAGMVIPPEPRLH